METLQVNTKSQPFPLSQWQSRTMPTRIKRLRRAAHTPSRAYGMQQIWLNFNTAMQKVTNTPLNELSLVNDRKDIQKEKRPQKPNKYVCWACV